MTTSQQEAGLVAGASSGIGAATALDLHDAGFVSYGVARRTHRMQALRDDEINLLSMDAMDEQSTAFGVKQILAEAGRIVPDEGEGDIAWR